MTGTVKETYLSNLHQRQTDQGQASLADYTPKTEKENLGTVISVVTEPTGGITNASDEHMPELGMPKEHLDELRQKRAEISVDNDVEAHNQAVAEINLEEKYKRHLEENEEARKALNLLADRVRHGETITIVCFEKRPKWCHRHVLKEAIKQRARTLEEQS